MCGLKLMYCPKCGYIGQGEEHWTCFVCDHQKFEINPKYGTRDQYIKIWDQKKYGEKTEEQCKAECDEFFKTFREEVVKNHPDYDPYLFEHREEICQQKLEEYERETKRKIDEMPYAMKKAIEKSISTPTITCPYCKSTNTKKISAVSRGLSFSIFGFGSKKVGKQWHCNKCGSDF